MRIKTLTATAAVALSVFAGAAAAQSVNPGKAQLAALLGVDANAYTSAQLIQLDGAMRENNDEKVRFIMSQAGDVAGRADFANGSVSQGDAQLARIVGVEPGAYTTEELIRLKAAQDANDDEAIDFILSGEARDTGSSTGVVTPGKAQLAANIGVNPANYPLAELVAAQPIKSDSEN